MTVFTVAASVADAACLAARLGAGTRIGIGGVTAETIMVPAVGKKMPPLPAGAAGYRLVFGTTAAAFDTAAIAPLLESVIAAGGAGFGAVCLANPDIGRSVYQGHLFQGAVLVVDTVKALARAMPGRVGLVPLGVVQSGVAGIRARLAQLKDQGVMVALIDAVSIADTRAVAAALGAQLAAGAPAWLVDAGAQAEPAPPTGPLAILSGALDRQTLFQIGAAASVMPVLQLDFSRTNVADRALDWARARLGAPLLIAASAPPDRLYPGAPAAEILAEIAARLAAAGVTRFVITGSDTAAAVLARLDVRSLNPGAAFGPLRWLETGGIALLIKPGGAGGRDLFLAEFGPYSRLNTAAE